MFVWAKYPFIRLTAFLCLGICYAYNTEINLFTRYTILIISLLTYYTLFIYSNKNYFSKVNYVLGILTSIIIFNIGCIQYENTAKNNSIDNSSLIQAYTCIAIEPIHIKEKNKSVLAKITSIRENKIWHSCNNIKALIFLDKKSIYKIEYGDSILIKGFPGRIQKTSKKNHYNFIKSLNISQIYYTSFVKDTNIDIIKKNQGSTFYKKIYTLISYCKDTLAKYIKSKPEYAVICALLLGDKDSLDSYTRTLYIESGTIHILAVSGLHVGIFYTLIKWTINITNLNRKYSILKEIICTVLLWIYAAITGFSASVLRATTMFTIVGLGKIFNKRNNMYNTLGISAFILLLFNPRSLFEIGFQLSYLAVIGIVYLSDKIYKSIYLKWWWADKLWNMTAVSLAAQIITIPISILYFSQFPTYFIFANWLIIPISSIILYLGLILISISYYTYVAEKIGFILERIVLFTNTFLNFLIKMPYHLCSEINLSYLLLSLSYITIISFFIFLQEKKFIWLATVLILIILQLCFSIFNVN